jgi:FlaA1/EpsC-like NDP-sugar epimerase
MRILITGGTGSLGHALVARWHEEHELTILSRNPHKQLELQARYGLDSGSFVLADICDYEAVCKACIDQDILIHAAALKVVGSGQQFPDEYIRVNVQGTQTVLQAWEDVRWGERAIFINSDKSVAPINVYGQTKALGEALFLSAGHSSLRYGNVVESEGSFIHKWQDQIARGEKIAVRCPSPTRFFLTMKEAVDLVEATLEAVARDRNGIFVPTDIKGFSLLEVARKLAADIVREPLQPGEKQHEELLAWGETIEGGSGNVSRVIKGWNGPAYASNLGILMTGEELLKELGISTKPGVWG